MQTLGLDLGTNSIGYAIRNTLLTGNQIEKYGVVIFKKGVGNGRQGEFSLAADRTKHRSTRRLYQARKYRKWATLEVLINNDLCPLSIEELNRWRKYNKGKSIEGERGRHFPTDNKRFDSWIKLDFNNDGTPDYETPYDLREELAKNQIDLDNKIDRYKLGRAIYHIAQRRGFKSNKGETIKGDNKNDNEDKELYADENSPISLKESEQKKLKKIEEYIENRKKDGAHIPTLGSVLADLNRKGERVRENWLQHTVRNQYEDELEYIFEFQDDLTVDSKLYNNTHTALFYRRPLRSQKGLVGKCTLEPKKARCPISHPEFETFRAWSFINNIKTKRVDKGKNDQWENLPLPLKEKLYRKLFLRIKTSFNFEDIIKFTIKETNTSLEFNYHPKTNVSACPVSARLRNIFGDMWEQYSYTINRDNSSNKKTYDIFDVWHVLFSFEDEEKIEEFASEKLNLDKKQTNSFLKAWLSIPQGYSMLSLKAIKNINIFLRDGHIYSEAVLLAKIPEIIGIELWKENEEIINNELRSLMERNKDQKRIINITNNLISKYKALPFEEQFAYKNTNYRLQESDKQEIERECIDKFGEKKWLTLSNDWKGKVLSEVEALYQRFFSSSIRDYYRLPHLGEEVKDFLKTNFPDILDKEIEKLYHPSQIDVYPKQKEKTIINGDQIISTPLLGSPVTGSFKNPMAMRTLHELKKLINHLLVNKYIDQETRIVVEVARELNDSNKRWAIKEYNRKREAENKEYRKLIEELVSRDQINENTDPQNQTNVEKLRLLAEQGSSDKESEELTVRYEHSPFLYKVVNEKDPEKKYRLWREQSFQCMYTGKPISFTDLFDDNIIDFEHTIPRSMSFDNSLANLTVCYASYNRTVKRKKMPTQLPEEDYEAILKRLKGWESKVDQIKKNIEYWKQKSKSAMNKESKDKAIRQRHLWQMEMDYWKNKLDRFKMKEVTSGFRHSQLIDTQLISKYAYHYLKSVFSAVDVQKGSVNADFRKIFGVQLEEKKDRLDHSHHAKDAAILTLIPSSARREELLKKAYQIAENTGRGIQKIDTPYPGFKPNHIFQIKDDVIIVHAKRNRTLEPTKKRVRKRGKVVPLKDENGQIIYSKDENGNIRYRKDSNGNIIFKKDHLGNWILDKNGNKVPIPIPKPKIATGDTIRGKLHEETFYGAVKYPKKDKSGKLIKKNGEFILDNEIFYVVREPLVYKGPKDTEGFKSIDDLRKNIVDPHLFKIIEKQVKVKESFKKALADGVYMTDRKGHTVNKIRHVRCWAKSGRGYLKEKSVHNLKEHSYPSKHDHKKHYHVKTGENFAFAFYDDFHSNRRIVAKDLMKVSKINKKLKTQNIEDFFEKDIVIKRKKSKITIPLRHIFQTGDRVLMYEREYDELLSLNYNELSKRLYFVSRLYDANQSLIQFQHHQEARDDKKLQEDFPIGKQGMNGFSKFKTDFIQPRLLLSPGNMNFLIESNDFTLSPDGKINIHINI